SAASMVAVAGAEAAESPAAFVATTVTVCAPGVSPVRTWLSSAASTRTGAAPSRTTAYPVIGDPPSAGALQDTVSEAPSTVSVGAAGAAGTPGAGAVVASSAPAGAVPAPVAAAAAPRVVVPAPSPRAVA